MAKDFEDVFHISPLTQAQDDLMQSLRDDSVKVVFGLGQAGTGKTLISLYEGIRMLKAKKIRKIYFTKPVVKMRSLEGVGFLPGEIDEKLYPLLFPVLDNLQVFCKPGLAKYIIEKKQIEPILVQDLRGRSLQDCLLIADESQNLSIETLKLVLTRIGRDSKFVILGDPGQRDVPAHLAGPEPLSFADCRLRGIPEISFTKFTSDDVVRSGVIKDILKRFEQAGM